MKFPAIIRAFALSALACMTAGALYAQAPAEAMFPSDVGWDDKFLVKQGEPALWGPEALNRHKSRLRMTIDGINCMRAIVRIDETNGQRFKGSYVSEYRCGRQGLEGERRSFTVSRREMKDFHSLSQTEGILQQPRQGWNLSDDEICLDGEEVLIEFVDDAGYRATGANMSCTAPPNFRRVAEAILELASADDAMKLLRP